MSIISLATRLTESLISLPADGGGDEACSELNLLIGKAFEEGSVSRQKAEQLLDTKLSRVPDNRTTCYIMIVEDLINNKLPSRPDMADKIVDWIADSIVINGNYTTAAKVEVMATLANMHGEFKKAGKDEQKKAVEAIFERVRESGKLDAFFAGISSVYKIDDEYNELTGKYILTFNEHAAKKDAIGEDVSTIYEYLKAVGVYSDKQAFNMKTVVDDTTAKWFAEPSLKSLWLGLMEMTKVGKKCAVEFEYDKKTGEPIRVLRTEPLNDYVEWQLRSLYAQKTLPEQKNIAGEVVRRLQLSFKNEIVIAHVNFLDYLLARGPKEVRNAMLLALREVDVYNENEMAVVRVYLKLINSVDENTGFADDAFRTAAIVQGEQRHRFHQRVIDYLTFWDGKNVRNDAHKFITDYKKIGDGREGPIIVFGIPEEQIEHVERVCKDAPDGEIAAQCENTIATLYREARKRKSAEEVKLSGAPVLNLNEVSSSDGRVERDTPLLGISYDHFTSEYSNRLRLLLGAEALGMYLGSSSLFMGGVRVGPSADIGDDVIIALPFAVGGIHLSGTEDDSHDVALKRVGKKDGSFELDVVDRKFTVNGFYFKTEPEVTYLLSDARSRRRGGGHISSWFISGRVMLGVVVAGKFKDEKASRVIDPVGAKYSESEGTTVSNAPSAVKARDEGFFGYFQSGAEIAVGFHWN